MGRPPTKILKPGQKASLGLKVTQDLKRKLDEAAKSNGRTQSQEAEVRLEQSFNDEHRLTLFADAIYGKKLAAIIEILAGAMRATVNNWTVLSAIFKTKRDNHWIDDPYAYDQTVIAANAVLEAFRPPGDNNKSGIKLGNKEIQKDDATNLWNMGGHFVAAMELYSGDREQFQEFIERAKSKLGEDVWSRAIANLDRDRKENDK